MAARTNKTSLPDSWKDKLRVGALMRRLKDHADGKIELSNTQVRSIEIILSRLVPTLSAVEQTHISSTDSMSEVEILSKISMILQARPELWDQLAALRTEPVQKEILDATAVTH
jgi:hypothetical protein